MNREEIWYATNGEIYDYAQAYKNLQFSANGDIIHNPSAIDVYLGYRDQNVLVPAGKTVKVYVTRVGEVTDAAPGTVVSSQPLAVACGDGLTLVLEEIQAENSRRMAAADYLRGHPVTVGTRLTN